MHIALIDDETLFREGLAMLITTIDPNSTVDTFENCEAFLETEPANSHDLTLLDFHLPGVSGFEALKSVLANSHSAPVVILSSEDNAAMIRSTVEQGASGFIPKCSTGDLLVAIIKLVLAGGIYLPPTALPPRDNIDFSPPASKNKLRSLSERQQVTLKLAVKGMGNKAIANEMGISEATVKSHLSSVYKAFGVNNRTEAIYVLAESGSAAH